MFTQQLNKIYELILETDKKLNLNINNKDAIKEKLESVHALDQVDTEIRNLLQTIGSSQIKNKIAENLIILRRSLLDYDSCLLDAQEEIKKIIKKLSSA